MKRREGFLGAVAGLLGFAAVEGCEQKPTEPWAKNVGTHEQTVDDPDGDGYRNNLGLPKEEQDCRPRDGASYPGAPEVLDGVDNNCDNEGKIDEDIPRNEGLLSDPVWRNPKSLFERAPAYDGRSPEEIDELDREASKNARR